MITDGSATLLHAYPQTLNAEAYQLFAAHHVTQWTVRQPRNVVSFPFWQLMHAIASYVQDMESMCHVVLACLV